METSIRQKISLGMRGNQNARGNVPSLETRLKMSAVRKGRPNGRLGHHHSLESRAKQSKTMKALIASGKFVPRTTKAIQESTLLHDSKVATTEQLLLSQGAIIIFRERRHGLRTTRPDLIYYLNGTVYSIDVKLRKPTQVEQTIKLG